MGAAAATAFNKRPARELERHPDGAFGLGGYIQTRALWKVLSHQYGLLVRSRANMEITRPAAL